MITVREATSADVTAITGIFQTCYGSDYPDSRCYNAGDLTKLISSDDTLVLVAEEAETAKVLGTASVLLEVGAYADLTGEFGRLAVAPGARHRGIATLLTQERLRRTQGRLQLAIIEARTADPFSQRIAEAQDFTPVGFLPHKWPLRQRESHRGGAARLCQGRAQPPDHDRAGQDTDRQADRRHRRVLRRARRRVQVSGDRPMQKQILVAAFAALAAQGAAAADLAAGAKIADAQCAACHGKDGKTPTDPSYPTIAGQYPDYLLKALNDYHKGQRKNSIVGAIAKPLSKADMQNVAASYGSLPGPLSHRK